MKIQRSLRITAQFTAAWWLLLVATGLVVLNVLLLIQNRNLRGKREYTSVAAKVGEITGIDVRTGEYRRIPYIPGRRFLILTYSGGCPSCRASLDRWKTLVKSLDPSRWSIIVISRDSRVVSAAFGETGLGGPMLSEVPHHLYVQLGLAAVPKSIVLSSDGNVMGVVRGEMNASRIETLERLLE